MTRALALHLTRLSLTLALVPASGLIAKAQTDDRAAARRPVAVLLIADDEYDTARTLPAFAAAHLADRFEIRTVALANDGKDPARRYDLPGLPEALQDADLLIVSARRTPLPGPQLHAVRAHVAAGKPVVGIRTASHAFHLRNQPPPEGLADWPTFDPVVLGGHYDDHYGVGPTTTVALAPGAGGHPILAGVDIPSLATPASLYRVRPLAPNTRPLLLGAIPGRPPEPIAWTFQRADGGQTFYTSLGHPDDFQNPAFIRLLVNAIAWAAAAPAR